MTTRVESMAAVAHSRIYAFDYPLLVCALMLMGAGLVMVMSSSGIMAEQLYNDTYIFFRKQVVFVCLGMVLIAVCAYMEQEIFYRLTYPLLLLATVLLMATLVPPFGFSAGGAQRWVRIAGFSFQPLELVKVALVFYLAYFFSQKQAKVKTFSIGFLPPVLVTGFFGLLLLLQPDFGGAVFLCVLFFFMSLVGGTSFVYLGSSLVLGLGCAWLLVSQFPYRLRRWTAFLDPFEDARDSGYQLVQSLYAFGSGGWTGQGLGAGKQKLLFLPEAHNDFIVAIIGEELGFVGISLLFLCMAVLLWRGFRIGVQQQDPYQRFLAYGMTLVLGIAVLLNMAVVLGMAPPKGVPMPFLSYGGSSLLMSCLCIGVLLNCSRKRLR